MDSSIVSANWRTIQQIIQTTDLAEQRELARQAQVLVFQLKAERTVISRDGSSNHIKGTLRLNGTPINLSELELELQKWSAAYPAPVIIQGDERVPFGQVHQIVEMAIRAGSPNLVLSLLPEFYISPDDKQYPLVTIQYKPETSTTHQTQIMLEVNQGGTMKIDDEAVKLVNYGLKEKLREKQQIFEGIATLNLQIDPANPYGFILQVLDTASKSGVNAVEGI